MTRQQVLTLAVRPLLKAGLKGGILLYEKSKEVIAVTKDVVQGAISGTEQVATGLLVSARSLAKGIVMGVSDVCGGR